MTAVVLSAQLRAPIGIVRGQLQKVTDASLTVQTAGGDSVQCGFDSATWMEREGQRIFSGALRAEDPVEIIADRRADGCYARTIRIVSPSTRPWARSSRGSLDYIFPRGNLTFSGIIRRMNSEVLVLRTREDAEKIVLLREDTRFLQSGLPASLSQLGVNTRVFVRGGHNLENDLEAYQIIWGEITGPKTDH